MYKYFFKILVLDQYAADTQSKGIRIGTGNEKIVSVYLKQ